VRKGPWKLVYWHAAQRRELFHLGDDIGETRDLSRAQPDVVAALSGELGGFLREARAVMPTLKSTGQPVPWPDELD
jgi:hypothetical protein